MFGETGVFIDDIGGKAQCHICGGLYDSVAVHIRHSHGYNPDQYRREFGLNRKQGLVGKDYRERSLIPRGRELFESFGDVALEKAHQKLTPLVRSRNSSKSRRKQTHINEKVIASRTKGLQFARKVVAKQIEEGSFHLLKGRPQSDAEIQKRRENMRKRFQENPEQFAHLDRARERKSEQAREIVKCVICQSEFSALKKKKRLVCSIPCRNKLIGINNAKRAQFKNSNRDINNL